MTHQSASNTTYILGAGPAGLSTAWWLSRQRLPLKILEASNRVGGTCVTYKHNGWSYDSGAHRFHDRFDDVTRQVQNLLREKIKSVSAPSQIYENGRYFAFPIRLYDLLSKLSVSELCRMIFQVSSRSLLPRKTQDNFESFAVNRFGPDLANRFLLNYSQKLWGRPCVQLSNAIQGSRLKGLDLKTFVKQMLPFSNSGKSRHLDGSFYYPDYGIGQLMEAIADQCGKPNIKLDTKVTELVCENNKITQIRTTAGNFQTNAAVVNTLPIDETLKILTPAPPTQVLQAAQQISYRNLVLVAVFVNRKTITKNATVYFPDKNIPFTRVYEPRNRSQLMSPEGKTSLVAEIPAELNSPIWQQTDKQIAQSVIKTLETIKWVTQKDILGFKVHRLTHAYPILETQTVAALKTCKNYLAGISNLHMAGRNGMFAYTHIHTIMRQTQALVNKLCSTTENTTCAE